jgi:invasion protein IalB
MTHERLRSSAADCRRPLAALTLIVALAGPAGLASAQQAPKKAPPAAPAQKAAPPSDRWSGWEKACKTASFVKRDAAGKEERKEALICLTKNEQIDGTSGRARFAAAIRQVEGQAKSFFMVTVPLAVMLQAGVRAVLVPKDLWPKAQRGETIDETKLKAYTLTFTLCHPGGCDVEMDATPALINDLKTGGGLMIYAINSSGAPVGFPLPLAGFEAAHAQQSEEVYRARIVVPKK